MSFFKKQKDFSIDIKKFEKLTHHPVFTSTGVISVIDSYNNAEDDEELDKWAVEQARKEKIEYIYKQEQHELLECKGCGSPIEFSHKCKYCGRIYKK